MLVTRSEVVVLVDDSNHEIGVTEKRSAHQSGQLHRAVSVFAFDQSFRRVLLQRRNPHKYHSGGLWANTCCGHPRPGETAEGAAIRRLSEEMGLSSQLVFAFSHVYRLSLGAGMHEHEYDHVFVGTLDSSPPTPDPAEVIETEWVDVALLADQLSSHETTYALWFRELWPRVMDWIDTKDRVLRLPRPLR
jgi:isopentenyl-diphosphate delta-isomerase